MPAKKKEPDEAVVEPTTEEAEAQAAEPAEPEPEVHPEEFSRGIEVPAGGSVLASEVVEELRKPLDPNRIRRRQGRGGGQQYEYLAGHDAKRRANEIFGFGNWGAELIELREEAAVPVVKDGRDGWHIAYRAVCRITVRDCLPFSDVGYGDGVEYGPAANATARELAMKEAATDAMKRALTPWGDQFGLILYAKDDEKKRIQRESNVQGQQAVDHDPVPKTWPEINEWANAYGAEFGWGEWLQQASIVLFGAEAADKTKLTAKNRGVLGQKASTVIYKLRKEFDPGAFPPVTRDAVQKEWAAVLEGAILPGPEWRFDPSETEKMTYDDLHTSTDEAETEADDLGAPDPHDEDEPLGTAAVSG